MKLTIELVPETCWFSNVRSEVSKKEWEHIRSIVASKAWNVCEICGGVGKQHPVECHEIWHYDDKKLIQKLEGMIALCPECHAVKHFGYAASQGDHKTALRHFMKINQLARKEAEDYIEQAFQKWHERSQKEWKLDISVLKDYGIEVKNG